jgi:hypothetical protein
MEQRGGEKQQAAATAAVDMIVNHHHHEIKKYDDPNFERKLDLVTAGGRPFIKEHLLNRITRENCTTIINFGGPNFDTCVNV